MLMYEASSPNIEEQTLVCLAGGGVAACELHAGVLKAVNARYGKCITNMAGGSAGGLISALYMSWGQDVSKLIDLINNTAISDWFTPCYWQFVKSVFNRSNYLMDNTKLYEFLKKEINLEAYDRVKVSLTEMVDDKVGRSFMANATPATTLGTMSIQNVFPLVNVGKVPDIGDSVIVGDGGVKNLIPVPRIINIPKYKHIIFSLVPESEMTNYSFKWKFLGKLISLMNGALEREMSQMAELHLEDLPNVTVFRPDSYTKSAGLLNWSDKHDQVTAGYDHAMYIMEENAKNGKVIA